MILLDGFPADSRAQRFGHDSGPAGLLHRVSIAPSFVSWPRSCCVFNVICADIIHKLVRRPALLVSPRKRYSRIRCSNAMDAKSITVLGVHGLTTGKHFDIIIPCGQIFKRNKIYDKYIRISIISPVIYYTAVF